jgi:hypothetical protein
MVTTPVAHVATTNENEESILQELIETIVAHKEELQQPHIKDAENIEAPEGLKELENQPSLMIEKSMLTRKFR